MTAPPPAAPPDHAASPSEQHGPARLTPGARVRVTQNTPRQTGTLSITVEGVIVSFEQQKTGSWYAHSKDDKLWLDRLQLRKDDGEIVVLNLDQFSVVQTLS